MLYCSISLNLKIIKEILKYVFMYYLFKAKENNYAFSIIARHTCTEYMFMESIHSSHSYPVQTTTVCSYALCGRLRWQRQVWILPNVLALHVEHNTFCCSIPAQHCSACSHWPWNCTSAADYERHMQESLMDRNVLASHRLDRFFACKIATEFVTR